MLLLPFRKIKSLNVLTAILKLISSVQIFEMAFLHVKGGKIANEQH